MSSSSSDEGPFDLSEDNFKILVLGEPGCGKTSFIRAFYDNNSPADAYSFNGVKVYPCKIKIQNMLRNIKLLEFIGDSQLTPEERKVHLFGADAIVLMYAIDDPSSFQAIVDKWINEITETIESEYLILIILGNKIDLQTDPQVIQRFFLNNETPLTQRNVRILLKNSSAKEFLTFFQCSTKDVQSVIRPIRKIILKICKRVKEIEEDLENGVY